MQLIEAVPNISEGKNPDVLRPLTELLQAAAGVRLLHVDANTAANRTVFTLVGEPERVCKALFDFISLATKLIDMRIQRGIHPRLGAVDVCPLIPLQNISLQQTALLAQRFAMRVAAEIHLPVYLYEAAALRPECKNLAFIRRGEYEKLREKLRIFPPDFGPFKWNENIQKTGACIIGARHLLIAFNINLNTREKLTAQAIALRLREKHSGLRGLKAIGWYMEDFKCAQVSCNVTDFRATPLSIVFEMCRREAQGFGAHPTGCELVGLVPLQAMLTAGRHFAPTKSAPLDLIQAAIDGLHLNDVKPFEPNEQILELKAGLIKL